MATNRLFIPNASPGTAPWRTVGYENDPILGQISDIYNKYWQDRHRHIAKLWDFYEGMHIRYLPRFEGETDDEYKARTEGAVVENRCRGICNMGAGYLYGGDMVRRAEDEGLHKLMVDRVWETNHMPSLMPNVALMMSVTGAATLNLQLIDFRTDKPFEANPSRQMVREYGSIRYVLLPTVSTLPILRPKENSLGAVLRIYGQPSTNAEAILAPLVTRPPKEEDDEVIDLITDEIWWRWVNRERVPVGGTVDGANPYGDVRIPFVVFKSFGDPMQTDGTPDHADAIPLNSDLNERLNDDRNVIRYHSFPVVVFKNVAAAKGWKRGPNSLLELQGEGDVDYLTWDNTIDASQRMQATYRETITGSSGFSPVSLGETSEIGQVRSAPALKTLFANDIISILLKQAEAEKSEKWLIRATAKMFEKHAGVKFESYKAEVEFPEDLLGIDELARAQIDAMKIQMRTQGVDEAVAREHPEMTDEEIRQRIAKSDALAEETETVPVQRTKSPEEAKIEQE